LALVTEFALIFEFVTALEASFAFATALFAILALPTAFAAIFAFVTAFEEILAAVTALLFSCDVPTLLFGTAVAAARLDGHWLTLDNRRMAMVEDDDARGYQPLFVLYRSAVMKYVDEPVRLSMVAAEAH